MSRIKITPEEVRKVAGQFRQAGEQSQEMISRLSSTVKAMESEWEGMTKQRFYTDFQQWESSMRQFVQLLGSISQQMDGIAARFESADRTA